MESVIKSNRDKLQALHSQLLKEGISINKNYVSKDNIFSVLNIIRKEVPYCRVLVHLIKNNWHSFDTKVLGGCCKEDLIYAETEYSCNAPCDEYEREGRMDILLKTQNHIVVIEVKVDAEDQEHQLLRYKKELDNDEYKKYNKHIFYLTTDGNEPNKNSLKCDMCKNKCEVKDYRCIGFNKEICEWLSDLVSEYEECSIAKDFLEVLKMNENNNSKKYVELLKESIDYPNVVKALSDALPLLWEEVRSEFLKAIVKELENSYGFSEKKDAQNSYNREIWPVALTKNNNDLYFCYETNFFFRTGLSDSQWIYVDQTVFDSSADTLTSYDTRKSCNAFNIKTLTQTSQKLLEWFYEKDEEKKNAPIKNIAFTANKYFDKHYSK